jgi:hypothetical protein
MESKGDVGELRRRSHRFTVVFAAMDALKGSRTVNRRQKGTLEPTLVMVALELGR